MTPAVAGNTVYVGSCAGVYYAYDLESGAIDWSHDFKEDVGQATFHGDPLLTGDLLITGSEALEPVRMWAFERATGRIVWDRAGEWALTRSDIVGAGDLAIGRNDRADLVALDARTGDLVWHVPHEGRRFRPDVAESPAVHGSRVFFSAPDGQLRQVEAATGRIVWAAQIGCDVSTSIAVDGDDLYLGCGDGRLFRLGTEDGEFRDTLSLGHPVAGRLAVLDDRVIVAAGRDWIGTVDRDLTGIIWERSDGLRLSVVQPLVWRGTVLTGTADGELLALDLVDGETAWSHGLAGSIRGLGHHGEVLLVGTIQGTVYALRIVDEQHR